MCGIVGLASKNPIASRTWLACGRDAMTHRGPDDAGEWWSADGRVGLAHRRLSIIDVSAAGHQPMEDAAGHLSLAFNGEIYNHRELRDELRARGRTFRTHSDTEVILAAYAEWDTDCLAHLNGMFAIALFDAPRRRLFLARDRAGEKPLYYASSASAIRFASELKALMMDPEVERRIDRQSLDHYLAFGFVPGDRSMFSGVRKLPPAHALTFDQDSAETRLWKYWSLPPAPGALGGAAEESELLNDLDGLLEDAVGRQLVADVPVGILLSGGVDSSLITAMAARRVDNVKTFTIRFPGHARFDETEHARLIARHFRTDHVELEAGEASVDLLPLLARQYDEPMVDSSMIPTYLVSRLVREHCTVALGGDGGDELFGGYEHYSRLLWLESRFRAVPRPLRAVASAFARALPVGTRGRNWLLGLGTDFRRGLPGIASYFDANARRRLLGDSWSPDAEAVRERRVPRDTDLLQRATRMDFENYLPEDILVKVDRASMLTSLEVRAPLLDYRVVEFAFGRVPSALKATAHSRKVLLKQLAAKVLPREFDRTRKQGFSIPLASWLRAGPWQKFFADVLLHPANTVFDHAEVRRLIAGQEKGRSNSERLFALVFFELWRREYGATR